MTPKELPFVPAQKDHVITNGQREPRVPQAVPFDGGAADLLSPNNPQENGTLPEPSNEKLARVARAQKTIFRSGEADLSKMLPLYLREVSQAALLAPEEEISLAKTIEAGKAAAKKLSQSPDSPNKDELSQEVQAGEHARIRMIGANLRLVVSVARHYTQRGLELDDLIEEGNFGLFKAVEKFDYRKGFKFSTYATWWIKQAVRRAIVNQARTIRTPAHVVDRVNKTSRTSQELEQELGREPTTKELAERLGATEEEVRLIKQIMLFPVSLSTPTGNDVNGRIEDIVEDDTEDVEKQGLQLALQDEVEKMLSNLSERERTVITQRFGLFETKPRTLSEIGEAIGVSRERARQIEADILQKLRQQIPAKLRISD